MGKAYGNKKAKNERQPIREGDNYSTHPSLTNLLLDSGVVEFDYNKKVLEPAAGIGNMVDVLRLRFMDIDSFDPIYGFLRYHGNQAMDYEELKSYSFLNHVFGYYEYIITNPPYSLADKFVLKAKSLNPERICFLLRTNFLSGQWRIRNGVFSELKHVLIFNRMPDLRAPIRGDGKFPTAMNVYAWFVWETGYTGKPMIDWLDCSKYVIKRKEMSPEYLQELIRLEIIKSKDSEVL